MPSERAGQQAVAKARAAYQSGRAAAVNVQRKRTLASSARYLSVRGCSDPIASKI
jgi:hypothetical protein